MSSPSGFDGDDWAMAASLGWFGMLALDEHGGAGVGGAGVVPAAIVAEELGRMLYPGPFVPVNVVVDALPPRRNHIAAAGAPARARRGDDGRDVGHRRRSWDMAADILCDRRTHDRCGRHTGAATTTWSRA